MYDMLANDLDGTGDRVFGTTFDSHIWDSRKSIQPPDSSGQDYSFSNDGGTKITYTDGTDIFIADWPGVAAINAGGTITNIRNLTQWDNTGTERYNSNDPQFNADDTKIFFKTRYIFDSTNINEYDWLLQYSYINPEQVTYDPDMAHPPTYKYWVLRVPVSFPEYT